MQRFKAYIPVLTTLVLLGATGCEKDETPDFAFDPAPPVPWRDLLDRDTTAPENEYTILIPQPTQGLFPMSLAIARIMAVQPSGERDDAEPGEYELTLAMQPPHDFLRWNSVFDDIRLVSEVFPLSQISLNGESITTTTLIESSQAMRGRLCLIYAADDIAPDESEVKGVLLDTRTREVLAMIHARGHYTEPTKKEKEQEKETESDATILLKPCTPRLVAERRFEQLTRDCILALVRHDRPIEPQPVEGWVPELPWAPRIWPPVMDMNPKPYTLPPAREQGVPGGI